MNTTHRALVVWVGFGLLLLALVGADYDPATTQVMTARQLYDQAFALVGESKQAEALETLIVLFKRYPRTSWAIKARGLSRSLEAQISNTYDPQEALASYGYKEPQQLAQVDNIEKEVDEALYGESVAEELGEKPPPPAPEPVKVATAPPAPLPEVNPRPASGAPLPSEGMGAGGEGVVAAAVVPAPVPAAVPASEEKPPAPAVAPSPPVVAAAVAPIPSEWKEERKEAPKAAPTPVAETKTAMTAPPAAPAVVPAPIPAPIPAPVVAPKTEPTPEPKPEPKVEPKPEPVAPPAPKPAAVVPPAPEPPAKPAPGTQLAAVQPVPLPAPVIAEGEAKRSLTNKDIQEVLSSKIVPIRFCFMKGLEQNPNIRGEVVVAFTVQPDGVVSDARVDSSTLDSNVAEDCLERRVMRMRFPPFDGPPVTKKVPFKFTD